MINISCLLKTWLYHLPRMLIIPIVPGTGPVAVRMHQGHYKFLVMPFWLSNTPAIFQALMNEIFRPYLRQFVQVFFDDILIYRTAWTTHLNHLEQVFEVLWSHQLEVKREKCHFGQTQISYLGHVISKEGVEMDPKKIVAITSCPTPITIKDLRRF